MKFFLKSIICFTCCWCLFSCSSDDDATKQESSNSDLLLNKYMIKDGTPSSDTLELEYNSNEQLVRREFLAFLANRLGYEYSYNEQNNLKEVNKLGIQTLAKINYDSNEDFDAIRILEGDSDVYHKYEFSNFSNTSYTLSDTLIAMSGDDISGELIYEKSVNYTLDNDNRLTSVTETNTETQETNTITFAYSAGNLVEINLGDEILTITYDNKRNFHTYPSFLLDDRLYNLPDCAGLLFLQEQFSDKIRLFPHFKNKNQNNPLEYTLNGTVVQTFAYEYNDLDYPSEILVNANTTEEHEIDLEYIPSHL